MITFSDPVVGQEELLRSAIKSENYVPNVSGWRIARDGSAEFNNVTVRGDLLIGTPPSPPNAYIHGAVLAGIPTIAVYDGTHPDPARIRGYDIGGAGGMVIDTGSVTAENTALALGGNIAELIYENAATPPASNFEFSFFKVGPPNNELLKMRVTSIISQDLEFGFDITNPTPDLIGGRMYTYGEILMNQLALDNNYATRVVDGKVTAAQTVTAVNVATDVNIGGANALNVYVEDGWCYRVIVCIDQRSATAGNRLAYKLWDGAVGGSQLGGTNRTFVENTGANFDHVVLIFVWRQVGTSIIANLNLSAARDVGAGNCDVATNAVYSMLVEKCGYAGKVGGL